MHQTRLRAALAGIGLLAGLILTAPGAFAATYPVPAAPANLPAAIEDPAPYVPQDSCDPTPKPGATDLARLLTTTYPDTSIIGVAYACGTDGTVSEHYEGRAIDWAIDPANAQQVGEAHALLTWLFGNDAAGIPAGNARRLGVMYSIYDAQIIGTYDLAAGWHNYPCSGVTGCHEDHVHLSLSCAGARAATSWWSGSVAATDYGPCVPDGLSQAPTVAGRPANPTPCPARLRPTAPVAPTPSDASSPPATRAAAPVTAAPARRAGPPTLRPGSTGISVRLVQGRLHVRVTGSYGRATCDAVRRFQKLHRLQVDGVVGAKTWKALGH